MKFLGKDKKCKKCDHDHKDCRCHDRCKKCNRDHDDCRCHDKCKKCNHDHDDCRCHDDRCDDCGKRNCGCNVKQNVNVCVNVENNGATRTGPAGPTGAAAATGVCECNPMYANFYNTNSQGNVPTNTPVSFNTSGVNSGPDFTLIGGNTIMVNNTGDYLINYSVIFRNMDGVGPGTGPVEGAYAIFIVGPPLTIVSGSEFGTGVDLPNSTSTNLQINGEVMVHFTAGQQFQLRNIGATPDHLANSVDGASVNSAALNIVRLDI